MKLNIAFPANGTQAVREMSAKEEQKLYGRKIGEQFDGGIISEEFAGCILEIRGGNDFQGVPMTAKIATVKRAKLLLSKGDVGYRCKRKGTRKRKTVRGSIISNEIQAISLVLAQVPEGKEITGLTDIIKEKSHFPKRVSKIRRACGIPDDVKDEDVVEYTMNLVRSNDPESKIKRIKATGIITEEEKKKRAAIRAEREARKEKFLKEKSEYETKYGIKL